MAEVSPDAILHRAVERIHQVGPPYDWVGIYLLSGTHLVLHSYIGRTTDLARIAVGQGVCGTAVAENRDINVPDVLAVDNYLVCASGTKSEIVVLIRDGERILGLIDIDSDVPAAFGDDDERALKGIAAALGELVGPSIR